MKIENATDTSFWDFKGQWEFVDDLLLMRTPWPVLAILSSYLLFVLKLGPAFMKGRQPYSFRNLLLVYNILQVVYSFYIFQYGVKMMWKFGIVEWNKCSINNKYFQQALATGHHLYFLAKVTELLDTIFFTLRKKWNQVSFLHVYHHTIMYSVTWLTLKWEPSHSLVFLGTLNSFVHIIMYAYYGLAAFPSLTKYLWWKKYITKMQLIQFIMVIIQIQTNTIVSLCPVSYILLSVCWFHALLFVYLFGDFYIKSYIKKRNEEQYSKLHNDGEKMENNGVKNSSETPKVMAEKIR